MQDFATTLGAMPGSCVGEALLEASDSVLELGAYFLLLV
jgi:hypothetical protein